MPTPPELCNIARKIGIVEVTHEVDTKQSCCTDSYVGVTREIAIYLERKEYATKQKIYAALFLIILEDGIHAQSTLIGNDNLFKEAPQYLPTSIHCLCVIEPARLEHLRQQICSSLNGACHKLWEETEKSKESHDVVGRLHLAPIHINGVAQCLESVERDAYREYYL